MIARKLVRAAQKRLRIAWWWATSRRRQGALTGDAPIAVSLTSYGHRLSTVFATIESIGAGSVRPRRLILWVAHEEIERGLPRSLSELARRGLEIKGCDDFRSHKKYYPYSMEEESIALSLVTADDDVLYPRTWLEALLIAHRESPQSTIGYRGELISFDANGDVAPYREWKKSYTAEPSFRLVLNGIGGILYPIPVLEEARRYGTAFMEQCPRADDLWMHRSALRAGFAPRQLTEVPVDHPAIPASQKTSLISSNADEGNDRQLAATYSADDLEKVRTDPARHGG